MKHIISAALVGIMSAAFVTPILADTGNGAPSGPHYNLNIIGVPYAKKSKMTGSNRHTIFVPMKSKGTKKFSTNTNLEIVDSKIWLIPGNDFRVCDGNGFDLAYGCDELALGEWSTYALNEAGDLVPVVEDKMGAVFELPCNTNLNGEYWDSDGDGKIESNGQDLALDELISCNMTVDVEGNLVPVENTDVVPTAHYEVWARALGKPGGEATVTTCATVQDELQCSLENSVLTRTTGRSYFTDVTNQLTSLVVEYCFRFDGDDCIDWRTTRVALFAGDTEDWFWNYDNNYLKLAQLRFYEVPE